VATELTCILFALDREAMFFFRACPRLAELRPAPCPAWLAGSLDRPILVLITGMGAAAGDRAVTWVLNHRREWGGVGRIISAGFCGALVPELEVGTLIQPATVIDSQGNRWLVQPHPRVGLPLCLLTRAAPVLTRVEREALQQFSGAAVVDMESAQVARRAREAGIPFACLRSVSDGMETTLPPALSAALVGEQVNLGRLAVAVLRRPWLVVSLWRLARDSRRAADALAAGLILLVGELTSP
jgi:adenosylhomocysteine nucleosidase